MDALLHKIISTQAKIKILCILGIFFGVKEIRQIGIVVLMFMVVASSSGIYSLFLPHKAQAATFTWQQDDWTGGLDSGSSPLHPQNQTGWKKYSAKSTEINATENGLQLLRENQTFSHTSADFTGSFAGTTLSGSDIAPQTTNQIPAGRWDTFASDSTAYARGLSMNDNMYMFTTVSIKHYNEESGSWTTVNSMPFGGFTEGGQVTWPQTGDVVYANPGGNTNFYKYDFSNNSWTQLAALPETATNHSSLSSDPEYVYYRVASGNFYRYSIAANSWSSNLTSPMGSSSNSASNLRIGDTIYATRGGQATSSAIFYKYTISTNTWSALTNPSAPFGGIPLIYQGTGDYLYAATGVFFERYSISQNTWTRLASLPSAVGSRNASFSNGGDFIYVLGGGQTIGMWRYSISKDEWWGSPSYATGGNATHLAQGQSSVYVPSANSIFAWKGGGNNTLFSAYSLTTTSWSVKTSVPSAVSNGGALVYTGGDFIYGMRGNSTTDFWRYSISQNSWTSLASLPAIAREGGAMVYPGSGDFIYVSRGNSADFYQYSISNNTWSSLQSLSGATFSFGAAMTYPGSGDHIYVLNGNSVKFWQYSISQNSWQELSSAPASVKDGGSIVTGPNQQLYVLRGNNSKDFWSYSLTENTWTTLPSIPNVVYHGSSIIYPGLGGYLYVMPGYSQNLMRYSFTDTYVPTGTYTAPVIDAGRASIFETAQFNATQTASATVKMQIRSATTSQGVSTAQWYGPTSVNDFYTTASTSINAVHRGHQFLQYRFTLDTTNDIEAARVNSVTLTSSHFPTNGFLESSAFNTGSDGNVVANITWTQAVPELTTVKFQIRSAPDTGGVPGVFSSYIGPDGTSSTYFGNPAEVSIPEILSDGLSDQWIQYKTYLETSDTTITPSVSSVSLTYVVNAPPEFEEHYPEDGKSGVFAQTQGTAVMIDYSVRDPDALSGSITPGQITPAFQYSLNNGESWTYLSSAHLGASDTQNKAVDETEFSRYSAVWNAKSQIDGVYTSTARIRVIANDNEGASNIMFADSEIFELDTKNPVIGNKNVVARDTTGTVHFQCTDDTALEMRHSINPTMNGASWMPYQETAEVNISSSNDVYVQCRDVYGNISEIGRVIIPQRPTHMYFQDISSVSDEEWRLFVAWSLSPVSSNFKEYNIYRSVNGGEYEPYQTITDRLVNYIIDSELSNENEYSYKVSVKNLESSESRFSDEIRDIPNGHGGTDLAAPQISDAVIINVGSTVATLEWKTDKISNSVVYFSATSSFPGVEASFYDGSKGVGAMVIDHSVTLSQLQPATEYYVLFESTDASGNTGLYATELLTFTTLDGPIISNVVPREVNDTDVKISWRTNIPTESYVIYSTSLDSNGLLQNPNTVSGSVEYVTSHNVVLQGLIPGTQYYYYVKSIDVHGNETDDRNIKNGVVEFYTFTTYIDDVNPVLTDVEIVLLSDTGATVSWLTDEFANSRIEWGSTVSLGNIIDSTLMTNKHVIAITGLQAGQTYYFKVSSVDKAGNESFNDNNGELYQFTTKQLPVIRSGGGQTIDTTPPYISNVKVTTRNTSATVSWLTDEPADSFVKFGTGSGRHRFTEGVFGDNTVHSVTLNALVAGTTYYFVIQGKDKAGNLGVSSEFNFTTGINNQDEEINLEEKKPSLHGSISALFESLLQNPLFSKTSEDEVVANLVDMTNKLIQAPVIGSNGPNVKSASRSAHITWITDKPANGVVKYSPQNKYKTSASNDFMFIAGSIDEFKTIHEVELIGLEPGTPYVYQIQSQSKLGQISTYDKGLFVTENSDSMISDVRFKSITDSSIEIEFTTDLSLKPRVILTNSTTGEIIQKENDVFSDSHQFVIDQLDNSAHFTLKIIGVDDRGNVYASTVYPFSTTISTQAPVISHVRTSSAFIPERADVIQTIVSWKTNKPSTSKIYYGERGSSELSSSLPIDTNLVTEHIAVTNVFKPGMVYKFKVESVDGAGTNAISPVFTILTPQAKQSVVNLIINNIENTFKFLR